LKKSIGFFQTLENFFTRFGTGAAGVQVFSTVRKKKKPPGGAAFVQA
jgi:hypothetical protein